MGVCGSDTNEVLHAGGADSCNSTDKENKSSPEDFDADSDWSTGMEGGATAAAAAAAATTSTCTSTTAATAVASAVVVTRRKQVAPEASVSTSSTAASAARVTASTSVVPAAPCMVTVPNRNGGVFGELKPLEDPMDILFARAEGLHAHGHSAEACELGVQLASELLANPPDLLVQLPPVVTKNGKKKKTNPACHQISCLASATLAKCAFLCTVLAENYPDYYHLAFRVGMFGLELARPPATTKPLEVKLAHQESELVTLLKRIPLGISHSHFHTIRLLFSTHLFVFDILDSSYVECVYLRKFRLIDMII